MRQVFFGARLFDGEAMIDDGALVIEDGAIVALTPFAERPRDAESHDLGGGVVLFNADPTVEAIAAIVAAHRGDGTTSLLPTLITDAPQKLEAALAAAAEAQKTVPGALGIHVEGPFIDLRRKGAHPLAFIRAMTRRDADRLIAARAGVMVV